MCWISATGGKSIDRFLLGLWIIAVARSYGAKKIGSNAGGYFLAENRDGSGGNPRRVPSGNPDLSLKGLGGVSGRRSPKGHPAVFVHPEGGQKVKQLEGKTAELKVKAVFQQEWLEKFLRVTRGPVRGAQKTAVGMGAHPP